MGNVLGVILGVGNRPRQGRAVLEILLLLWLMRKIQQRLNAAREKDLLAFNATNANNANNNNVASSLTASSLLSPPSSADSTTSFSLINPDGSISSNGNSPATARNNSRRPSLSSTTSSSSSSLVVSPTSSGIPSISAASSRLVRFNDFLQKFHPVQIVLSMVLGFHVWNNLSLLLGLNAPHTSIANEPDMHYSKNFANVRWLLTSLDAATLSTLKVKIPILRHALTFILSIYYLANFRLAENQVNAFRRSMTHEAVRACWEKGTTPLLATVDRLTRHRCVIDLELLQIPSPDGHMIECRLFYHKPREQLRRERRLILDFPGGGFIAMSPNHHADYLSFWARELGIPILSVNYRKAPKYPFPCGFEDCWYVYKSIVDTNGEVVGINSGTSRSAAPIKLAVAGDSAGGNLTAGITIKAIIEAVRVPDGIHLIYPVLDFSGDIWRSTTLPPRNTVIKAREHKGVTKGNSMLAGETSTVLQQKRHECQRLHADAACETHTPTCPFSCPPPSAVAIHTSHASTSASSNLVLHPSPPTDEHGVPQLSSRHLYAFDGVLPLKYMLLLADCYFRNGGDPVNNPFCSPMAASDQILAKFPPIYAHVGSVDPLVDDMIKFARRAQRANPDNDVFVCVIPKISHAYLHVTKFLPEAKLAVDLSALWFAKVLEVEAPRVSFTLDERLNQFQANITNFKDELPFIIAEERERQQEEIAAARAAAAEAAAVAATSIAPPIASKL